MLSLLATSMAAQACVRDAQATSFERQPAQAKTPNPFMEGINTAPATQTPIGDPVASTSTTVPVAAPTTVPATAPAVNLSTGADSSVAGDTPGLYGGTRNKAVCNATKMAAFLKANPDKAAAWAAVLGITTAEIPDYIARLTPTTLRVDTAVINHGFKNGKATTVPAVLQAGTAVFVDDRGVPVVKCSCGNPLRAPASRVGATFTGPSWKGFSPRSVTTVRPSPARLNDLAMVDRTTNTAFTRPVGTDGDADVPYVEPTPGSRRDTPTGDPADTTTTAAGDLTTTTTTGSTTTSTTTTAPSGETVIYDTSSNGTGGVCAGVAGVNFELSVVGNTVIFDRAQGPVRPDGTFDFTVNGTVGGGMGGSLVSRFTGRLDQGPPWLLNATREDTITSPTGTTTSCTSTYTGTRRGAPADTTTTTTDPTTTTTTAPTTTTTTAPPKLTEQTWYFDGSIISVGDGCRALGIKVDRTGPDDRIRVRDTVAGERTVTFLGRPSRTLPVGDDDRFGGVLVPQGDGGNPDQMQVTTGGGPVPFLGTTRPRPFQYGYGLGESARVPGTFRTTWCSIANRA